MIRLLLLAGCCLLSLTADASLLLRSAGGVFGPTPPVIGNCLLVNGTTTNCLLVNGTTTNTLLVR